MTKARQRQRAKKRKETGREPGGVLVHLVGDDGLKAWCGQEFGPLHKIAVKPERTTCPACKKLANRQLAAEGISRRL